jgi:formate dehydrogenase subunit gamma
MIAKGLNLSRADVHGVVSFYHDFHDKPDLRPVVQVCRAEACKARGVEAIIDQATAAAGDRVKVQTVYCLGLCSSGPSARVGDRLHARLDAPKLAKIIENA